MLLQIYSLKGIGLNGTNIIVERLFILVQNYILREYFNLL